MKKIISMLIIIFVLSMSCVTAQSMNGNVREFANNIATQQQERVQQRANVTGIERALLVVQDDEALAVLEGVLAKVQQQTRERLNQLDDLVIGDANKPVEEYKAVGNVQARLLGILPLQRQVEYRISNTGAVKYIPNFLDVVFSYEQNPELV